LAPIVTGFLIETKSDPRPKIKRRDDININREDNDEGGCVDDEETV
jgi:hypothetical protein